MMIYLALLMTANLNVAPVIVRGFNDMDDCRKAAEKLNASPAMKHDKDAIRMGAEAVCLAVTKADV